MQSLSIFGGTVFGSQMITIMSSLAQEENRSISENVSWGYLKRFANGKVSIPYKNFLGYRKGENDEPEIVPEEAGLVQRCKPSAVWAYLETAGHVIVFTRRGKRDRAIMSIETHACMSGDYEKTMREVEETAAKWRAERKTRRQQEKEAKRHDPCGS